MMCSVTVWLACMRVCVHVRACGCGCERVAVAGTNSQLTSRKPRYSWPTTLPRCPRDRGATNARSGCTNAGLMHTQHCFVFVFVVCQ